MEPIFYDLSDNQDGQKLACTAGGLILRGRRKIADGFQSKFRDRGVKGAIAESKESDSEAILFNSLNWPNYECNNLVQSSSEFHLRCQKQRTRPY